MFVSRPNRHHFNVNQAPTINAKPALLTAPDGGKEPAVVLYSSHQVQGVMPVSEALRVANEIADSIAAHRN